MPNGYKMPLTDEERSQFKTRVSAKLALTAEEANLAEINLWFDPAENALAIEVDFGEGMDLSDRHRAALIKFAQELEVCDG